MHQLLLFFKKSIAYEYHMISTDFVNGSELMDHMLRSENQTIISGGIKNTFFPLFDETARTLQSDISFDILIYQDDEWIPLGSDFSEIEKKLNIIYV